MSFPPSLPHGPIERVVDGVYAVRGSFRMAPGMTIGRTMTVAVAPDGLVVCNAIRLGAEAEAELARLGEVKHLVKLSDSHGVDEPYYVDRYRPEVWAVRGTKSERVKPTRTLGPDVPVPGARVLEIPNAAGWAECALLLPHGGGTLVTCDVLQNHRDEAFASTLARIMTPLLGFTGGVIVASMWRRNQKLQGPALRESLASLVEPAYENLVTGHGPAVVGGARERARAAIDAASR